MTPGQVVLLRLPQPDTFAGKLRPTLVLADLPGPFGDVLVCGISSQLHQELPSWDERITPGDPDFPTSGLKVPSLIRLNWLASVSPTTRAGTLGSIAPERLAHLRTRLVAHLALPYPP